MAPVPRFVANRPSQPWEVGRILGDGAAEEYRLADLPTVTGAGTPGQMLNTVAATLRGQMMAKGQVPIGWKTEDVIKNVIYGGEVLAQILIVAVAGELEDVRGQLEVSLSERNALADDLDTINKAYTKLIERELPDLYGRLERALERIDDLELRAAGPLLEGPGMRVGLDDDDGD